MVTVDARFPHLLKDLRHDRGVSLRELAARVHYSHTYLWDIETGRKQPTSEIAEALDTALSASGMLAELVTEDADAQPVDRTPFTAAMQLLDTNRSQVAEVARLSWVRTRRPSGSRRGSPMGTVRQLALRHLRPQPASLETARSTAILPPHAGGHRGVTLPDGSQPAGPDPSC